MATSTTSKVNATDKRKAKGSASKDKTQVRVETSAPKEAPADDAITPKLAIYKAAQVSEPSEAYETNVKALLFPYDMNLLGDLRTAGGDYLAKVQRMVKLLVEETAFISAKDDKFVQAICLMVSSTAIDYKK